MRVLVLCDRYPFPLENGQNLRIYHYVKRLALRYRFDLVCYENGPPPQELDALFEHITSLPQPAVVRRTGLRRIVHALSASQMIARSPAVQAHLDRVLRERAYDLVWVSGWEMIVNLPHPCKTPILADAVDDGVLEHWRNVLNPEGLKDCLRNLKAVAVNYHFEKKYFGSATEVLFVAEQDARWFSRIVPVAPVSVVHNGVDEIFFNPSACEVRAHDIVFEGSMAFRPNALGILDFCRHVLPRIRERIPDVRLTIVGRDPPRDVRALSGDGVEVTGRVDDVRHYLSRAAVFVCPLRRGAGIKNKVLQAWAMGRPVVATAASIGGLAARDGENILVRDGAASFANAVVDLLRDPVEAARLGAVGRETVLAHYTWDQKACELERILLRMIGGMQSADT